MKTATWKIGGMHCTGCAETIKLVIDGEPGVKASEVSYESASARVLFDPAATSEARLVATVERAGFEVNPA